MKIYVASSWRNPYFDVAWHILDNKFDHVYNFRTDGGFNWSQVLGPAWEATSLDKYKEGLKHPSAEIGFTKDKIALESASATVLILPAGASAHLELGVAIGRKQFTAIFAPMPIEPELMYAYVNIISDDLLEIVDALDNYQTKIWNAPAGRYYD